MYMRKRLIFMHVSIVLKHIEVFWVRSLSTWECFETTFFSLTLLLLEWNDYPEQDARHYKQISKSVFLFLVSICDTPKMMWQFQQLPLLLHKWHHCYNSKMEKSCRDFGQADPLRGVESLMQKANCHAISNTSVGVLEAWLLVSSALIIEKWYFYF